MTHAIPFFRNHLLATMTLQDLAILAPCLEPVELTLRTELEIPNAPTKYIYFPETTVCSIIATMSDDKDIEVGVIGRDGIVGVGIVHWDDRSPYRAMIQAAGKAHIMLAKDLLMAFTKSETLRPFLGRYARAFTLQVASTALANGRCSLEDRLARWILMVHDRVDGNRLTLTHEFLSVMLGVRRPGVTVALHLLEGKGLIRSNRSEIVVHNREGLKLLASGAYGIAESEHLRLTGWSSR